MQRTNRYYFFFNDTATTEIYTLSLHDALPISPGHRLLPEIAGSGVDPHVAQHHGSCRASRQECEHDIRNRTGGHSMVRTVFALFASMAAAASASAATSCEALARLTLPGASIASAVSVTTGNFT